MTSSIGNHHHHRQPPPHRPYYSATPSYYSSSSSSSSSSLFKGCCCCLFLLFSLVALVILALVLVILLAVKPKKPHFDLQQVSVQNIVITTAAGGVSGAGAGGAGGVGLFSGVSGGGSGTGGGGSGGGATLSFSIRLQFSAANPNKVGIKYGESRFTVMYRGIPLGRGTVAAFYQPARSVKEEETVVTVERVNLMEGDAVDLIKDASVYDKVEFRVLGEVSAKIRVIDRFDSPSVHVSVDCAIVISPRKQALTYKQCGFDGLSV